MVKWVKDQENFQNIKEKYKEFLILMFYGNFSSTAKRALTELENFSRENEEVPVYVIDVERVRGVHKQFGVKNVPTVLAFRKGEVTERIEGVESAKFYAHVFCGVSSPYYKKSGKKEISPRVVVYTSPGCPPCGTAKAYLRKRGINFRAIDISKDQHAAERLVHRSGQMAVPQIDINGHLVVGFDQAKIDRLLSS